MMGRVFFQVPGMVDYFRSFINLLCAICEDKNNATESKIQQYFSIEHLNQLISLCDKVVYVKSSLYLLFYHVYLDTEREMREELQDIKNSLI